VNSRQEDLLNSLDDISQAKWDELQDSCVEGIQVSQVAPNALTAAYVEACPGTCTILQIFAFRISLAISLCSEGASDYPGVMFLRYVYPGVRPKQLQHPLWRAASVPLLRSIREATVQLPLFLRSHRSRSEIFAETCARGLCFVHVIVRYGRVSSFSVLLTTRIVFAQYHVSESRSMSSFEF